MVKHNILLETYALSSKNVSYSSPLELPSGSKHARFHSEASSSSSKVSDNPCIIPPHANAVVKLSLPTPHLHYMWLRSSMFPLMLQ